MRLADQYRRQFAWRDWGRALGALPDLRGKRVLDLGCAHGDLTAELASRGAEALGVDLDDAMLELARGRRLPNVRFSRADLRDAARLESLGPPADGIWCSFAAAYFTDFADVVGGWARLLVPGGWIAVTEVDDLFAHEPLSSEARNLLDRYVDEALRRGRYDFRMGRKLRGHLERSGLLVMEECLLEDAEFAFEGSAPPAVQAAWQQRFERMAGLREYLAPRARDVQEDFLSCLQRADHRSHSSVCFVLARRPG